MLYRLLADLVVLVHLGFIAFVAIGGLLAVKWPRLVRLHVSAVLWAAAIVTIGFTCPLTPLEKHLRERAGASSYDGGFVDHYLDGVVYPGRYTALARVIVAVLILGGYIALLRHQPSASTSRAPWRARIALVRRSAPIGSARRGGKDGPGAATVV